MKEEFEYDSFGRMGYHPEYHSNHGTVMTEEELEYLCKFSASDGMKSISMALGRTEKSLANRLVILRREGKYDYYRSLNNYI